MDDAHCTHGGRKGLMQTHRVSLRVGIASGQCAAHALGVGRPALFNLKGPLAEGADRLCAEAEPGHLLMSPAVESLVGKTVDGLTRVQLKERREARTAEEQAALEAEKELEDVVEAQRTLDEAKRLGSIEMIRKAEEKLQVEVDEAAEAVRAADEIRQKMQDERDERERQAEEVRQAKLDAATGPRQFEFGWRNGERNVESMTKKELRSGEARRRLMTHRPASATAAKAAADAFRDATKNRPASAGGASVEAPVIWERTSIDRKKERDEARAVAQQAAGRPQSARPAPVLQNAVLEVSWNSPSGIARPGSAFQASATAMPRRRPESAEVPGSARGLQPKPPQSPKHRAGKHRAGKQQRAASAGVARVSITAGSAGAGKARPQSARPVVVSRMGTSGGNRPGSAQLFQSPARKLMERQNPTTAPMTTVAVAAAGRAKARVAVRKIAVSKIIIDDAGYKSKDLKSKDAPARERPSSARPVLESYMYAFAAHP